LQGIAAKGKAMTNSELTAPISATDQAPHEPADVRAAIPQWLRVVIALVIALGIFFRFYHLDRKVLWEDEVYATVHMMGYTEGEIVQASPKFTAASDLQKYFAPPKLRPGDITDVIGSIAREDPQHPPPYYVLGHLWVERFGSSVSAMRSLSALCGLLVLPCMYFLCIELFASRTAAWLGVAIVAISPFHVLYAQEVREYGLWTAATLLMSLTLLRAMRLASVSAWVIYCITFAVSMYIYPLSGLVALGEGVFLIVATGFRPPKVLLGYLAACTAGFALFVPWLLIMIRSEGLNRGLSVILTTRVSPRWVIVHLIEAVRSAFFDFGPFHYGMLRSGIVDPFLTIFVLVLIGYALVALIRSNKRAAGAFALIALCLPMLPLVLHDLLFGGELVSQARYFIPLYLGVELLIVDLLRRNIVERTASNRSRGGFVVALIVLLAGGALSCATSSQADTWANKSGEQNRAIADIVSRSYHPLVVSDFRTSRIFGLGYYLDPNVRLKLNLRCDLCSFPWAPRMDMLDKSTARGEIFLLGPSAELEREADRWATQEHRRSDMHTIDVQKSPHREAKANPLTMFTPS
jgi:uncharacterized membrane protein